MRSSGSLDLLAVVVATLLGMISAVTPSLDPVVRLLLAVTLVVLLPGYSMAAVLFARRRIRGPEMIALSLGLSLAAAAIGGVVLHLSPWGLRAETWALLLGGGTLVSCASAAGLRQREGTPGPQSVPPRHIHVRSLVAVLLFGLAVSLTAGAIVVAQNGAREQPRPGFTQLWLTSDILDDHVMVGIHNSEGRAIFVRLTITSGGSVLTELSTIRIGQGETWTGAIRIPGGRPQEGPVVATLFDLDDPTAAFRVARLWPGR